MNTHKTVWSIILMVALIAAFGYATQAAKADLEPCRGIVGNEQLSCRSVIPYIGGRGPGDQVGTTAYDYQANGAYGQRILVDDYAQAHIDWMWQDYPGQNQRYCAWNARFTDGSYYGEAQGSPSWSGYVQLDITQDANPDDQRTAIAYHFDPGSGYYSWVDIDQGNCYGSWPNNPVSPQVADRIWPYVAVASNNNIILETHGQPVPGDNHIYAYLTTDQGSSWSSIFSVDSCAAISQFTRASRNAGSQKVVMCWTMFITDTIASGQLDNNVWYMLSTDNGVNWTSPTNLTNYQPSDSVRAYTDVNAVFDANDDLHIAWTGRRVTDNYYEASKIFHWDEISSNITVVNSPSTYYSEPGGWWIETATGGDYGGWRLPADHPQLIVDPSNNDLLCMWLGNDDYTDASAGGYVNGEFYGSTSHDNGASWSNYVNLTNTHSPGAGAGACDDEDYGTACPYVANDSVFITYVEDKDAGGIPQTEGVLTENPVRCWLVHKSYFEGVEEQNATSVNAVLSLAPNPAAAGSSIEYTIGTPGNIQLELFDAAGRSVRILDSGYQNAGVHSVPINTRDLSNGSYFVVLETPSGRYAENLIVIH
ncbi:T9SS type A sorting domain-containing protein [candidate division WOR-3 bacterium]|nr:T9SS type A sorting domain-containing protein [candidate division WOR-3 bacterium]